MVQAYKDKVQKEESRKARRREAQINREQTIQKHIVIWEKEILPEWENKYVQFMIRDISPNF